MTIYLYIKQHSITGLKYFGKTASSPFNYDGSGIRWINHINKHGREHIKTLDVFGFDIQEEATEFALKFSSDNDIVESLEWANLIPENAKDGGGNIGIPASENSKLKNRVAHLGKTHTLESKEKCSIAKMGKKKSKETRKRMSEAAKNRSKSHLDKIVATRKTNDNYKQSEKTKEKISSSCKGKIPWNKGLKLCK